MASVPAHPQHKRTTSSKLKSIITSRNHKHSPSAGTTPVSAPSCDHTNLNHRQHVTTDQSATGQAPLGELAHNQPSKGTSSPRKVKSPIEDQPSTTGAQSLHKKTLSSISLASLAAKQKHPDKGDASHDASSPEKPKKSNKSKSQVPLGGFLSRAKSFKSLKDESKVREQKDKENQTPPQSSAGPPATPIWAQFASRSYEQSNEIFADHAAEIRRIDDEISLYTPVNYSPSKQRNFHDVQQPTLGRRAAESKSRPRSDYLSSASSAASIKDALTTVRRQSGEWIQRRTSGDHRPSSRRDSMETGKIGGEGFRDGLSTVKRGSRVIAAVAAVAAFSGRMKEPEKMAADVPIDIEAAFEALLDSRNIPQKMRQKMRSLDDNIKVDFIRQDKAESQAATAAAASTVASNSSTEKRPLNSVRPGTSRSKTTGDTPEMSAASSSGQHNTSPSKRGRPRSRTFTFSKADKEGGSPTKKQKAESGSMHGRVKSLTLSRSGSSKSLRAAAATSAAAADCAAKTSPAVPEDFVAYLREVQKPEDVEVGRIHKLRLVLRNERVAWVDSFITMGGMTEIVGLLNRIMEIEWREEHEDSLLHEALLCLKALCTTALALQRLLELQSTLFPALLGMLFDEEKKGPSEFATRGIITSLLLTHLTDASAENMAPRARTILSYLRDPGPKEDAQPLGFIVSMHQTRPYRVWCKEVVNVTKEVFWIFLHNLNVIALPSPDAHSGLSYAEAHFPKERPPVPAAPYVGGVEWEATNYMASHLDLLNGIIASLPTAAERNSLRYEMKVSGFERMMGGSLRTCKEKFYGAVHDGLRTWVAAAAADGWDVRDVRMGPPAEEKKRSGTGKASPKKKKKEAQEEFQKIALPQLDLKVGQGGDDGGWI